MQVKKQQVEATIEKQTVSMLGKAKKKKKGKELCQGCIFSPYLFNFYGEYTKWNSRLDEALAGIKIARRNINNLRCADDITLMAEVKSLLMKVKEESEKLT